MLLKEVTIKTIYIFDLFLEHDTQSNRIYELKYKQHHKKGVNRGWLGGAYTEFLCIFYQTTSKIDFLDLRNFCHSDGDGKFATNLL